MLESVSLEQFKQLAKKAKKVSVFQEILADRLTPMRIYESLSDENQIGAILESGLHENSGRYSFIYFEPIESLVINQASSDCLLQVREFMSMINCHQIQTLAAYNISAIGFFTYDAVRHFESIPDRHKNPDIFPDVFFRFYRTTLIFDHTTQKLCINLIVEVSDDLDKDYLEARQKINALIEKLNSYQQKIIQHSKLKSNIESELKKDIDDKTFHQMVEKVKEYIVQGDAFQIVLSRTFIQSFHTTPFTIYRALRRLSPAPYMFYLPFEDSIIVGASPEKLISVENRKVTIHPIAGTRSRNPIKTDEDIAADLLSNEKEVAEHMMLVDLARNDVGAVCKPGSINIEELKSVKHFSHVSHIASTITGELREECDALDAFKTAFPAGTLSGAPKIRAMEIIDEIETTRRGLYGGAICRMDCLGNLDSCIAIRMAILKEGVARIRTGAGIVYDSTPQAEAEETEHKARGMLEAIKLAQRELS